MTVAVEKPGDLRYARGAVPDNVKCLDKVPGFWFYRDNIIGNLPQEEHENGRSSILERLFQSAVVPRPRSGS